MSSGRACTGRMDSWSQPTSITWPKSSNPAELFPKRPGATRADQKRVEAKTQKSSVIQHSMTRCRGLSAIVDGDATTWQRAVFGVSIPVQDHQTANWPQLRCLIAALPLGPDTQRWFEMLGIPVYQVYGLTETTAIVTMDKPGRAAGPCGLCP